MKAFADLYTALDETTKTNEKVAALARYFAPAPPADAAWAVYFLIGRKPRQVVPTRKLARLGRRGGRRARLAVRGVATTPSATSPRPSRCCCRRPSASSDLPLHDWVEERLLPLRDAGRGRPAATRLVAAWRELDGRAAVRLEQADHRRVPRRRLAAAGRSRALAEVSGIDADGRSRTG